MRCAQTASIFIKLGNKPLKWYNKNKPGSSTSQHQTVNKPILFLGYNSKETSLISSLQKKGRVIVHTSEEITWSDEFDLIISFGYKHIIRQKQINSSSAPIINLHISYLPWNKGAHPNFCLILIAPQVGSLFMRLTLE